MVGDGQAQGLIDHGAQRAHDHSDQAHHSGEDDEDRHVPEGRPRVGPGHALVTPSTMSFMSQTVSNGSRPWSTVSATLAAVRPGAIDQTSLQCSAEPQCISNLQLALLVGQPRSLTRSACLLSPARPPRIVALPALADRATEMTLPSGYDARQLPKQDYPWERANRRRPRPPPTSTTATSAINKS